MTNPATHTPLTDDQVAAIRARLEAADWGPWKVYVEVLEKNEAGLREFPAGFEMRENRIGTAHDHPQLKGPLPIITTTSRPYCTVTHGIHLSDANAYLIAHAPDDIRALLADRTALTRQLADYALLREAVNASTTACSPDCTDEHAAHCPSHDPARWLIDQQREIAALTRRVEELTAERDRLFPPSRSGGVKGRPWLFHSLCRHRDRLCVDCATRAHRLVARTGAARPSRLYRHPLCLPHLSERVDSLGQTPMTTAPPALTERQADVARLIVAGYTDKQIAAELEISDRRVRQLIGAISTRWALNHDRDVRVQIAQRVA